MMRAGKTKKNDKQMERMETLHQMKMETPNGMELEQHSTEHWNEDNQQMNGMEQMEWNHGMV